MFDAARTHLAAPSCTSCTDRSVVSFAGGFGSWWWFYGTTEGAMMS